jgi:hypothetical protein
MFAGVPAAALAGGVDFPFGGTDGLVVGRELLGLAALVALFFYRLHPRQFPRKVTVELQTYVAALAATNRWVSGWILVPLSMYARRFTRRVTVEL